MYIVGPSRKPVQVLYRPTDDTGGGSNREWYERTAYLIII